TSAENPVTTRTFYKLNGKDIVELLLAADELIFEELIYPLQDYLLKNKLTWIQENILYVLNTVIGLNAFNTPNLKNLNIVNWGTKEFNALEKTLQRCIPLIRFGQFSIEEFTTKVKPYIRILPSNLRSRIVQHLLAKRQSETIVTIPATPERAIDSVIITHQQAALIAGWIDRKQVTDSTSLSEMFPIPYYFRDVEWRGTRDSFIFSLGDGKELSKAKLSRIKEDYVNDAIQLHDRLGPSFGFYELKIVDDAARAETSYASGGLKYEHTIRDKWNYFRVDDYEVFQVLKK
ncbi:27616_t:CDS:2, partial [Dentiscutata erythropus]